VAWDKAWIGPGVKLEECIVGAGVKVHAAERGKILL
jgi:hypothetical protein